MISDLSVWTREARCSVTSHGTLLGTPGTQRRRQAPRVSPGPCWTTAAWRPCYTWHAAARRTIRSNRISKRPTTWASGTYWLSGAVSVIRAPAISTGKLTLQTFHEWIFTFQTLWIKNFNTIQCSRIFFTNDLPTGKWPPQIHLPALVTHLPIIITVHDFFCRIFNACLIDSENLPVYPDLDLNSLISLIKRISSKAVRKLFWICSKLQRLNDLELGCIWFVYSWNS